MSDKNSLPHPSTDIRGAEISYLNIEPNFMSNMYATFPVNWMGNKTGVTPKKPIGAYNCKDVGTRPFVGRKKELDRLSSFLAKEHKHVHEDSLASNTFVISGMAGVGKSSLALQAVKMASDKFENIVWIPAESKESMLSVFAELAVRTHIPKTDSDSLTKNFQRLTNMVYEELLHFRTLIVFDNAEYFVEETSTLTNELVGDGIENFLPKLIRRPLKYPKIIITSRYSVWKQLTTESIQLSVLPDAACFEYITERLKDANVDGVRKNWKCLSDYFGGLILAVESAVDAIIFRAGLLEFTGECYTIEKFMETLLTPDQAVTDPDNDYFCDGFHSSHKRLQDLWSQTFDLLQKYKHGDVAIFLLDMLSFLSPCGVPLKLFNAMSFEKGIHQRLHALRLLESLSLIQNSQKAIHIHRFVQQMRIKIMRETNQWEEHLIKFCSFYEKTLPLLSFQIQDYHMFVQNATVVFNKLKPHFELLQNNSILTAIPTTLQNFLPLAACDQFKALETFFRKSGIPEGNELRMFIRDRLIESLVSLGKFLEAETLSLEAESQRWQAYGENNSFTLAAMLNSATLYEQQGKYNAALDKYNAVLEIQQSAHGKDHPDALTTRKIIASLLQKLGKYNDALQHFDEVLKAQRNVLPEDDSAILATMAIIASTHHHIGNFDKALENYYTVLKIQMLSLGYTNPEVLATKSNVASVLHTMGKLEEAFVKFSEIFDLQVLELGTEHPNTLSTKSCMAKVLQDRGNYSWALQVLNEVHEVRCRVFGQDHPFSITAKHNIASVLHDLGKYEEVHQMLEEIVSTQAKYLGPDHPYTLTTKHNIASVLQAKGEYERSLKMYQEVLEVESRILGDNHPSTLSTRHNIGVVLHKMGGEKGELAIDKFKEILAERTLVLGKDHPLTLHTQTNLGLALQAQSKFQSASEVFQQIRSLQVDKLGVNHPDTQVTCRYVMEVQKKLNPPNAESKQVGNTSHSTTQ